MASLRRALGPAVVGDSPVSPRVVVVTTSYPQTDDDPAGHFVRSHALRLAREGARVHVLAPFGSASDPAIVGGLLHVHPAGGSLLFGFPGAAARFAENPLRLAGAAAYADGVRRRLRELAPFDRVVAHWIVPGAWPLLAGVDAPLHVVSHGADVRLLARLPAALRASIVRSLLDRGALGARFQFVAAHLLATLAASLPRDLAARLEASSFVEPAPLELPDVGPAAARLRASLEMKVGEPLAVCVGRLVPEKRYNLALAGVARVAPRVRLAIVGDGPERLRLSALAARSGVLVTSTGALPRSEALAWIAAADVLVHPSATEGAPTVVREARALGTSVVACAAGDLERWAESDAGIAIVSPDPRAIGDAVQRATSACHAR